MAISTKGVIAYKFYEKGGSNKERFLNFLQENILFKMKNKLLLFDNARSHTAKDILENIKESENDYILNIPYNPQTNPIESFFSELKHYIKLDSKIEYNNLLKSIKKSHYNNQNRIMNNYISKKNINNN
jgi:transposase